MDEVAAATPEGEEDTKPKEESETERKAEETVADSPRRLSRRTPRFEGVLLLDPEVNLGK